MYTGPFTAKDVRAVEYELHAGSIAITDPAQGETLVGGEAASWAATDFPGDEPTTQVELQTRAAGGTWTTQDTDTDTGDNTYGGTFTPSLDVVEVRARRLTASTEVFSSARSVTVGPAQLETPALSLAETSGPAVNASWAAVANAEQYVLERADDSNFSTNLTTLYTGLNTSYEDTTVTDGNSYFYRLKAQDTDGPQSDSEYDVATVSLAATILPQDHPYQVTLYNAMEQLVPADFDIPTTGAVTWDGTYADLDELADLWLQTSNPTNSRCVRGESSMYVLDDGAGGGIEGSGVVRILHTTGYGEAKAWQNELAHLWALSLPDGGGEGNPYYQDAGLLNRCWVMVAVDLMVYDEVLYTSGGGGLKWYDMYGKAFMSWAQSYRIIKDALPADVEGALYDGLMRIVSRLWGDRPRDANTNMDTFPLHGLANMWTVAKSQADKDLCVEAFKRAVFGYRDGVLGTNHDFDLGIFDPSGFVAENDCPDPLYNGLSMFNLLGGLVIVTDRSTGAVPAAWSWLEELVRRMCTWRSHQIMYDPGWWDPYQRRDWNYYQESTGYASRTYGGLINGEENENWRDTSAATFFDEGKPLLLTPTPEETKLPSESAMVSAINDAVSAIDGPYGSTYTGTVPEWNGWESWCKFIPYLPPEGWYSTLKALADSGDPLMELPCDGPGHNTAHGGELYPPAFWTMAQDSNSGKRWAAVIEAMEQQGAYKGWFGGKLESFWTPEGGVYLKNVHSMAGPQPRFEDTSNWDRLVYMGCHHTWGRLIDPADDITEVKFSTNNLRDREGDGRIVTYDDPANPTQVLVENIFQSATVSPQDLLDTGLEGDRRDVLNPGLFKISHLFERLENGVRCTHTIESDGQNTVNTLHATIPVYMRAVSYNRFGNLTRGLHPQINLDDTTIDVWASGVWTPLTVPDRDTWDPFQSTQYLRLGRDYKDGRGPQYVYVAFDTTYQVRRAPYAQHDVAYTKNRTWGVHIDLNNGYRVENPLPTLKEMTWTIQVDDPTL